MKDFWKRNRFALLIFLCAAILLGIGLYKGQAKAVLNKAARICMECVGLG